MHHPLTKTIPFVLPKDNTVTLSHPERYLKTRLVSYSRKTAAQHVFLSLTEAKPSKDKAALSAFFRPRANTEGRSVLHGCQVSAEDRPRSSTTTDSRQSPPSRSGIPLYAPHGNHLHICRSNVCAFREGRPNSIIELWYAVSGQGGDGRTKTDRVRERKEIRRSRGDARGTKIMRNIMREFPPGGCFGSIGFSFFFWSWICLDLRDLCNFDERMI